MIKANELRIGNKINVYSDTVEVTDVADDGTIGTTAYFDGQMGCCGCTDNMAQPIPLTPEILEKCGFENKGDWEPWAGEAKGVLYYLPKPRRLEIIKDHMKGTFHRLIAGGNSEDEYGWYDVEVKSLHQLQNLFFALTGAELTISL